MLPFFVVCLLQLPHRNQKKKQPGPASLFITESKVLFILLWKYRFMTFRTIHNSVNNQKWNNVNIFHNASLTRTFLDAYSCSSVSVQIFSCLQSHLGICICETADLLFALQETKDAAPERASYSNCIYRGLVATYSKCFRTYHVHRIHSVYSTASQTMHEDFLLIHHRSSDGIKEIYLTGEIYHIIKGGCLMRTTCTRTSSAIRLYSHGVFWLFIVCCSLPFDRRTKYIPLSGGGNTHPHRSCICSYV